MSRSSDLTGKYKRFGISSGFFKKDDKYTPLSANFVFNKKTYPEFIYCVYNQLLKDGFKVVGMEARYTPVGMKAWYQNESFVSKLKYILKKNYNDVNDSSIKRFKELIAKDQESIVHLLNHPTYGVLEINIIENPSNSVLDYMQPTVSVKMMEKDKYSVSYPYFENLFYTSKILINCLDKQLFPPIKRPIGIYTISDYDTYAEVFTDVNFRSTCPVCLTTQPKDQNACRYTYHTCNPVDLKHPDQKKLYDMFKSGPSEVITWCASCNRICQNHGHFNILKIDDVLSGAAVPRLLPGEFNVFSTDCAPYGGGFLEKFIRYENLLRESAEIQKLGAGITLADAKIRLVKALWNGPLVITDVPTIEILKTKKFTVSRDLFSTPGTEIAPEPPAVELTRDSADMALLPEKIETPGNICFVELGAHDDSRPTWKFKHRKGDGTIYEHPDTELICADDFMSGLTQSMHETGGKCFINPASCDAIIHPFEVKQIIGVDDPRYVMYERFYRERVMRGGGEGESVFPRGPDFQSACPIPKKTAGKRRKTFRSKHRKVRNTRRTKHNK
jgi:hypothetical protein